MPQQQLTSRFQPVTPEQAPAPVKEIYATLKSKMGSVLNTFQNMGQSPVVLEAYIAIAQAVNRSSLPEKVRQEIALATSQYNKCNYCLAAHTAIAKKQGLSEQDILSARQGKATEPKAAAILKFSEKILATQGRVSDRDVEEVKAAGVSEKEIAEIVLAVVSNVLTNYFNNVTDTPLDFPPAPELRK
jgi:uncharacterized peroxidase-related enzyme